MTHTPKTFKLIVVCSNKLLTRKLIPGELKFYGINSHIRKIKYVSPFNLGEILFNFLNTSSYFLVLDQGVFPWRAMKKLTGRVYIVNPVTCHDAAWEWHSLATTIIGSKINKNIQKGKLVLTRMIKNLKNTKNRVYVFGTGPSLKEAIKISWVDGHTIVCNTIVKDKKLWNYLKPVIFTAGDALYHFSSTPHGKQFRNDLKSRLRETPYTIFVYPSLFDACVQREFKEFSDRLAPIPPGGNKSITGNLLKYYVLPDNDNVLGLLLLPLATNISKNIFLWGFDGRSPKDNDFWKNSTMHSYESLKKMLKESHPAFFKNYVPKENQSKYADQVQGNDLDQLMTEAEEKGWHLYMMHKSWSNTLNIRYLKFATNNKQI